MLIKVKELKKLAKGKEIVGTVLIHPDIDPVQVKLVKLDFFQALEALEIEEVNAYTGWATPNTIFIDN